jgi:putative transposase
VTERLHRLEWVFEAIPIHFVTAVTSNRQKILANPAVHEALERFADAGSVRGAWLGAYVLMPDHFHGFVAVDAREISLSVWMKSFKNTLSKALRTGGLKSPHWQKGFFDHILRSAESYAGKWDYVRQNPVHANLVSRWEEWPYLGEPHSLRARN